MTGAYPFPTLQRQTIHIPEQKQHPQDCPDRPRGLVYVYHGTYMTARAPEAFLPSDTFAGMSWSAKEIRQGYARLSVTGTAWRCTMAMSPSEPLDCLHSSEWISLSYRQELACWTIV